MSLAKDLAGNFIDPVFNAAVYTAATALSVRSIFTDKGPIAKPPLTLQSGSGASLDTFTEVTLPGAFLSSYHTGKYLTLSGGILNGGTFRIMGVISPTRARVQASFSLPDPNSGSLTWEVFDPRDGLIADDPTDVVVLVNGSPVVPEAVIGLLGQIVLPSAPVHGDDVKSDYSWVCNPTVDILRLNSKEFRLNSWNRNVVSSGQHTYRYNNVLLRPSDYVAPLVIQSGVGATITAPNTLNLPYASMMPTYAGLNIQLGGTNTGTLFRVVSVLSSTSITVSPNPVADPSPISWQLVNSESTLLAQLDQPQQRDLKYRAFERAYSVALNDPNLLLLNSPNHKIAYPPLQRTVSESFINYQPTVLPENDPVAPWIRKGSGTASISFNRLLVGDDTTGPYPGGQPLFWTRGLDLTFPNAFAMNWEFNVDSVGVYEGVWSGLAAGYSNDKRALIVGYLEDGGVKKIGILKSGYGNDPSVLSAWTGGLDLSMNSTGLPADLDWSVLHSYRVFRSSDGMVRVYIDGEIVESLKIAETDLPMLAELNDPFDQVQGAFFGSLSRPAMSQSSWDFVRYLIMPTNPMQTAPSVFGSYEGDRLPEVSNPPWTIIGFHGTETLIPDRLLLDSTSASDETLEPLVGWVGGDFRGFFRIEPLLQMSSDVMLDVDLRVRTCTHGITPNAVMAAIDDGNLLLQLSLLSDTSAPKLGYGGRSLPTDWTPTPWSTLGSAPVEMHGRILRITDDSTTDGRIYFVDDTQPEPSPGRVLGSNDYIFEFRCQVRSYTTDVGGFAGGTVEVYDGARTVGVMFREVSSIRYLTFHSEGLPIAGGDVAFDWFDGLPHTYRLTKDTVGNLLTLFIDGTYVSSIPYSDFSAPAPSPAGVYSFGSATTVSLGAKSVVDWYYVNSWRVITGNQKFVGFWKGQDSDTLVGYHLPLKAQDRGAPVGGNALVSTVDLVTAGVTVGDYLVIDYGDNKGVYEIASVGSPTVSHLTITTAFPSQPSAVDFRIPKQTDWSSDHRYRITRNPGGSVSLFLDLDVTPLIIVGYNAAELPSNTVGLPRKIGGNLGSIMWGAFDPTNLSQTEWDYVRYGITRSPTELRIAPHHQVLNQRNVIASPEHIMTMLPHSHTDFWSRSTGQPPQTYPDFLQDESLVAFTLLNDTTPLVPLTQDTQTRGLQIVSEFVSSLNRLEDVLNTDPDFILNDGIKRTKVEAPEGVLYSCLTVYERSTGEPELITPFCDGCGPNFGPLEYLKDACLEYEANVLPENDTTAATPWSIVSDIPGMVSRSAFSGILTYGTTGVTRTVYKNYTPLPDAPGLTTEAQFRLKVLNDGTVGTADSQIRVGLSAPGLTVSLAFVTSPLGERLVLVLDQNNGNVLGSATLDFLDGNYHTYRLVRDPGAGLVRVFID